MDTSAPTMGLSAASLAVTVKVVSPAAGGVGCVAIVMVGSGFFWSPAIVRNGAGAGAMPAAETTATLKRNRAERTATVFRAVIVSASCLTVQSTSDECGLPRA